MKKVRDGYKMTELGEIPEEWEIKKIKDIANICYGKSQKEVEVEDGKYKILGTGGVIGYTNDFLWNRPSVLIGRKGTIDKPQYIEEPFWTVDTLFYTKINENYIAKWFYYYLDNIDLKKYNEATGVPSLSVANLNTIRIATPTKKEQEKIASILSTVDEQIDNVDALIEKNKELKKGLMQTLLTKGIGHTKFKKTEIGEIPEEWEIKELSELYSENIRDFGSFSTTKLIEYVEEGIPYLRAENFRENKIVLNSVSYITEEVDKLLDKSYVYDGNILFTKIGNIGCATVYRGELGTRCNSNATIAKIKIDENIYDSNYIVYFLNSLQCKKQYIGSIISTPPRINMGEISKFKIAIPKLYEQTKIASILLKVDSKIEEYENKKIMFEELKKGLMQQLLTGRIRV